MLWTVLLATIALAMLYLGGESLVRGASALAVRLGVSSLAVGLSVVAFGTSLPELVVSLDAALTGANDISVGNVVGSNIANLALILGVASLVRPWTVEARIVRIDGPIMILVSLGLAGLLANGALSRLEGTVLVLGIVTYVVFTLWKGKRAPAVDRDDFPASAPGLRSKPSMGGTLVVAGLALLIGGGHLLVRAAVDLAISLEISQAAIGLTIVAVGTSLPELATSVIASWRGQGDMAVGNVVGSNIFNILGILGITAVIRPLDLGAITGLDLGIMVGLACALTLTLYVRPRLGRVEGGVLLAGFVLYTGWRLTA